MYFFFLNNNRLSIYLCACDNLPSCSNILSHSSRMKCFKCFKLSFLLRIKAKMRPGVPTTMCGVTFFKVSSSFCMDKPPKKTPTLKKKEGIFQYRNSLQQMLILYTDFVRTYLYGWHIFRETFVLLANLECKFASMTHD